MILKDVEHQIINEYDQCGNHYLICKDFESKEIKRYVAVRSEQERNFWPLILCGEPIRETRPVYRETISKIFEILLVNETPK